MATDVSVIVIGAGIAGLASADHLVSHSPLPGSDFNFKIRLLEGSSRAGGRICTVRFGDEIVEKGATWLHGTVDNPMSDLLHQIRSSRTSSRGTRPRGKYQEGVIGMPPVYQTKGREIDSVRAREVMALYDGLLEECNEMARKPTSHEASLPCADVGSYLKMGLAEYMASPSGQRLLKHKDVVESLFSYRLKAESTLSGCDSMDDVSLQWFGDYQSLFGGNVLVREGMTTLVDALVNRLPEHCLCYNSVVDRICWSNGNSAESKPVTVYTRDGRSYGADHVIFTGSLGVLKHCALNTSPARGLFDPALPPWKQGAISRLGISAVEKVFVRFEERFWDETFGGYHLCWPLHDERSKLYHNPNFSWLQKLSSLSCPCSDSSVMIGWLTGKEVLKMNSESDFALCKKFRKVMKYFSGRSDIPEVVDILHSDWSSNELFRGGYSFPAVGCSADDFGVLAQPLPQPMSGSMDEGETAPLQLLFAGEATHQRYYSTLHGAYLTGIREANRIITFYQQGESKC